jgi:predicted DNA-binding transcriptional regulator AlpA
MKATIADLQQKALLRPSEVIQLFGISRSKFWNWANSGSFPVLRPDVDGKVAFVKREDFQRFLETGKPVAAQAA